MTENQYQRKLLRKLEQMFPGCVLLRNDPQYQQGILDWTILYGDKHASLEIKASRTAALQPNQQYYLRRLNDMSFAALIYPENEEEVLGALQQALAPRRRARVS